MKTVAELNDKHFLITGSQKSTLCKAVQCIIDMRVAIHQNEKIVTLICRSVISNAFNSENYFCISYCAVLIQSNVMRGFILPQS